MKSVIKLISAYLLFYSGILGCYSRYLFRKKAFVLTYHRILRDQESSPFPVQAGMYVTEASFIQQISFLKKNYNIISLPVLVKMIQRGESIGRCCCLTFDDGWLDNYQFALPILKEFGVPATVFLPTGYVGTDRWFWPDLLAFYMSKWRGQKKYMAELPEFMLQIMQQGDDFESAIEAIKRVNVDNRKKILDYLNDLHNNNEKKRVLLNWSEVREMANSGLVSFGSHTVSHVLLDQATLADKDKEVVSSKMHIEEALNLSVSLFAYPNGNYDEDTLKILRREQFDAACTTNRGYVDLDCDLLEIPRISVHEDISLCPPLFFFRLLCR